MFFSISISDSSCSGGAGSALSAATDIFSLPHNAPQETPLRLNQFATFFRFVLLTSGKILRFAQDDNAGQDDNDGQDNDDGQDDIGYQSYIEVQDDIVCFLFSSPACKDHHCFIGVIVKTQCTAVAIQFLQRHGLNFKPK